MMNVMGVERMKGNSSIDDFFGRKQRGNMKFIEEISFGLY